MKKWYSAILAATLVFSSLISVNCFADDSEPYKYALYCPMTGDNAQYGQAYSAAIKIYVDELNENGGIDGHQVVVDVYDDKNDAKEALNVANLIVSEGDYLGVVGSQTSSCCLAAAPVFQKAGIPMITPQGSHPDITPTGEYIFRLSASIQFESGGIAQFMVDDGVKKAAIIYASDDFGLIANDVFTEKMESNGVEIAAAETYVSGQTKDFTPLLSTIKNAGADGLYIAPGYSDAAMILTQMDQLDMDIQAYGSSMLFKEEFLDIAGEYAEGVVLDNFFLLDNDEPTFVKLSTAYEEATGKMTDIYAENGYDAIMLLCQATEAVGTDRAAMADWIQNVKDWQGSSGVINFDENRNPERQLFRFVVKDGEFVHEG